jgi:hypothetical protein
MTGKRRYTATFDEFAEANMINNGALEQAIDLDQEDDLPMEQWGQFYEPNMLHRIGNPKGLRHYPALINKIARVTFLPKGGNRDVIREKFWNVIHHIMYRQKFDLVRFMMNQLAVPKHDMTTNLYFAPYIMSLILQKTKFRGECEVMHVDFRPYYDEPKFYERALTPFPLVEGDEEEAAGHDEHMDDEPQIPEPQEHGWVPPAGYFDPYFQGM